MDSRLAAEEPELGYTEAPAPRPRRHRGQISGSPHDGPSFDGVAREEFDRDDEDAADQQPGPRSIRREHAHFVPRVVRVREEHA